MNPKQAIAAALLCATRAGCASAGHDAGEAPLTRQCAAALLVPDVTTKDDVRRAFGEAIVNTFPSGREVWFYQSGGNAQGVARYVPLVGLLRSGGARVTELKILSDRDGRLSRFKLQDPLL